MHGLLLGSLVAASITRHVSAFDFNDTRETIIEGSYPVDGDESYPIIWRRAANISSPRCRYPGFNQSTTILEKGSRRREGARALLSDITFERDVPITLRDGVIIYADVFRPTTNASAPAIISWSPYGKEVGGQWLDDVTDRSGVPLADVSELQKFEGADPAYWVAQGYAVINPDARGAYSSEGNQTAWGTQLGKDGYDVVEWVAAQSWSNGKIALSGNSYLAISQWFIAAQQPPHLAAIAPWEGDPDIYRHSSMVGGIPSVGFQEGILTTYCGLDLVEDTVRMTLKEPLITPYWKDKIAQLENIDIPAYVVASYTNTAHTLGTFYGWQGLTSDKWLRIHNSTEWPDYYDTENVEDLRRFFDRYLKGIDNGWENTPRVRNAILNPGGSDILGQAASDWPPPDMEARYLYPRSNFSLGTFGSAVEDSIRYGAVGTPNASFSVRVDEDFDLIGFSRAHLWVEAIGSHDMDVEISIHKLSPNGSEYSVSSAGSESVSVIAASGRQRISKRHTDSERSSLYQPHYTFDRLEFIEPGDIVPVDVGIWPIGLRFTAGEILRITVSAWAITPPEDLGYGVAQVPVPAEGGTFHQGQDVPLQELGGTTSQPAYVTLQEVSTPVSPNRGAHVLHFGGQYDSFFVFPTRSVSKDS